jgi:hypothetical protein
MISKALLVMVDERTTDIRKAKKLSALCGAINKK